jgi:TolB-like protein/AraC-like DNA-binding protein
MNLALTSNKEFIQRLTELVEANLGDENFGVMELLSQTGMAQYQINRRLRAVSQKNISQFIREIRLKKAMKMLEEDGAPASEVAFKVGFSSSAYFNTCFHKYYGYPPGDVKRRLNKGADLVSSATDTEKQELFPEAKEQSRFIRSHRRTIIFASAGILGILIIVYLVYSAFFSHSKTMAGAPSKNQEKSIAILPFKNLSENKENQYFADGVMEGILNNLFRVRELRVISRTSVEQFRESTMSSPQIGEKLGINYLLEGSVERDTNEVRVFVQLIDARKDQHIYSEQFDRKLTDIFAIQSDIAKQIANELDAILSDEEIMKLKKMPTKSPEAYDYYLKGRFLFNKATDEHRIDIGKDGLMGSISYFEKAIAADTNFAEAYSVLAHSWFDLASWGWLGDRYRDGILKAKEISDKALEIDPASSEAHTVKGAYLIWSQGKFEEGRKELKIAIQLNQNNSWAHQCYAQLLMITGPIEEARIHMERVLELEPNYWVIHNLNAWIYYFEEKYNKGIKACVRALELNPGFTENNWLFFLNYAKMGEGEKAAAELQTIVRKNPVSAKYADEIPKAYKKSGIPGLFVWLIELNMKRPVPDEGLNGHPFFIAWWYAILGDREHAIYWLEKNMERNMEPYYTSLIATNPDFDILRSVPRFLAIIEQTGLSRYNTRKAK